MAESISGYIEHIIFRNEENGYTVMTVEAEQGEITCVGNLAQVHEGAYIEAEGETAVHALYGPQFHIGRCVTKVPEQEDAFLRYLGSGAIRGIGGKTAKKIIDHFGSDTRRILMEEPERLAEIKGISAAGARKIGEQIYEQSQMQNALIYLAQYGISLTLGVRIYHQYQDSLYEILQKNPYQLAEDIDGVGFRIADRIAERVGIAADSEFRIRSGLLYCMNRISAEGHTWYPLEALTADASELLGVGGEEIRKCLTDLTVDRRLTVRREIRPGGEEETRVFTDQMYYLEVNTARMLCDLNVILDSDRDEVEKRLRQIEKQERIELDDLQKKAVVTAAGNGLMILTGGPGTGKTTTINTMIRYFLSRNLSIALAAPTGRAAKRMMETTGYEASTIHRLLEIEGGADDDRPDRSRFGRNAETPLEADVVIIDEVSMVDIYLMHALLSAVVPGTRLILVGDVNQLPSVGPGSVLKDMIRGGACEVVRLEHIFRQAAKSDIVVNAHKINRGEEVRLDNKSRDFFFLERSDVRVIQKVALVLVRDKLPRYADVDPFDIQVLTPMRRGPLGVEQLNGILQRYLNPPSRRKGEIESAGRLFREGDKVMQIRNDYQAEWTVRGKYGIASQSGTGVFNGDMGRITMIDSESGTVEVTFDEARTVLYSGEHLEDLELAYAVTIHKSQGSEYPAVVIPLLSGPSMLMTRNLLYTAVTRARKCVVLVGSKQMFRAMERNEKEQLRYTALADRIREIRGIQEEQAQSL
jgi:exodeoxyribonuclease V alpha subunit